mmetsp:Transcript_15278/g.38358  ORF Transcript_15278/g.38358 Transcript_15278/m.38358 type:complete len:213 (-) Transcript_15278:1288-1926(-)
MQREHHGEERKHEAVGHKGSPDVHGTPEGVPLVFDQAVEQLIIGESSDFVPYNDSQGRSPLWSLVKIKLFNPVRVDLNKRRLCHVNVAVRPDSLSHAPQHVVKHVGRPYPRSQSQRREPVVVEKMQRAIAPVGHQPVDRQLPLVEDREVQRRVAVRILGVDEKVDRRGLLERGVVGELRLGVLPVGGVQPPLGVGFFPQGSQLLPLGRQFAC